MGGVAGHMDHLYENRELTFGKIKEILNAASNGELTAEEKVDGQNLFLSYSIPEGKAKGARNKGNLKSGGLDGAGLAQKFAGRGGLTEAFTGGFSTFEKAVEVVADTPETAEANAQESDAPAPVELDATANTENNEATA